ncbi:MAG TPA: citrate synthase [Caulobacteraceae bacterium]|jgi:citrate synthase|nr:citrate synthase [Caulobacteraceae bacterium]
MPDWLTAAEAQSRLKIRAQTLYAYASRGRVEAKPDADDPRRSLYRATDVARLEERKARGRKAATVAEDAIAWGEPVMASSITTIFEGRLYYRGRDAVVLAETEGLEQVARLLRGGDGVRIKARPSEPAVTFGDARARLFAVLAAHAAADPPARGRAGMALSIEAAGLLDAAADAVAGRIVDGPIHTRLAEAWNAGPDGGELIRRALVLLADHELNSSTFAARVAASTGASLAAAALAGLSALSGPLHGGMIARVESFIGEAGRAGPEAAVRARIAQGLPVPGFGHPLYPVADPRAEALLAAFTLPDHFAAVLAASETLTGERANVDFALTALSAFLSLPKGAAFLLFAIARLAGWQAHALEQLATGRLIRPRARYIGPQPSP